jgi:hypothetical protein
MSPRLSSLPLAFLFVACVFDPKNTEGLPCNADEECGDAFVCVEHVCGGPDVVPGGSESGESGESGEDAESGESDGAPTPNDPEPDECNAEQTECLDSDVLRYCGDDGKLRTIDCRGGCGPYAESLGCRWSEELQSETCACKPEHEACEGAGAWKCEAGTNAAICDGVQLQYEDCDEVCAEGGWSGATGCGIGADGQATCECGDVCLEAAQRCDSASTISGCFGGVWYPENCTTLCQDNGWETSLGCVYSPASGDSVCQCW